MNDKELYFLLEVIKNNGNIKKLIYEGVSYVKVAQKTNELIDNNFAKLEDNKIQLTTEGENLFSDLRKLYKKTNKDTWIEKDIKSQIPKMDKNFIFVPRQDELTF